MLAPVLPCVLGLQPPVGELRAREAERLVGGLKAESAVVVPARVAFRNRAGDQLTGQTGGGDTMTTEGLGHP